MTQHLGLRIRHHTGFHYDGQAKSSYNEARMTPRTHGSQIVSSAQVLVRPIVPQTTYLDYFGTLVTVFDIQEPHHQLEVEATSTVESWDATLESPWSWGHLRSDEILDKMDEYLRVTPRTAISGEALELRDTWRKATDIHDCVAAVAEHVREQIRYVPGATTVSATAQEAWSRREGVCQDIAHVTIGVLRSLGIAARYVSGYLYPSRDPEVGETVAGQSHAWVEYFSGTWTAIDPTNGVRQTAHHIVVGYGRDYDDVAPLKGIYQGPASSGLGVVVEMTRIH